MYACHQRTDRHAADKQRRKNAKVINTWCFFSVVLRIAAKHCFHGQNFLRGHGKLGIKWRDFTWANPSELTSLLAFVLSSTMHFFKFSLRAFHFDCRWYVICLQFIFTYFSLTSLPRCSCSVSGSAFKRVQVSSSDKKGVSHTSSRHAFLT